jgi:hypothetical protein
MSVSVISYTVIQIYPLRWDSPLRTHALDPTDFSCVNLFHDIILQHVYPSSVSSSRFHLLDVRNSRRTVPMKTLQLSLVRIAAHLAASLINSERAQILISPDSVYGTQD